MVNKWTKEHKDNDERGSTERLGSLVKNQDLQAVTHLSTNPVGSKATMLMRATPLAVSQTTKIL